MNTLDDELAKILDDPLLEISPEEQSLYDLSKLQAGLSRRKEQRETGEVASRRICEDFELFRPQLEQVRQELSLGIRQLVRPRKATTPEVGGYYVIAGEIFYLAEVRERTKAQNRMKDGRTRCIYSNGTESNILLETLRKGLDKEGGYIVTEPELPATFAPPTESHGEATGYIYILRSCSTHSDILSREHLYKIGFTTGSVEERTKGAESDPTYLCAPVKIVETYETYGMNAQTFEGLIHRVLDSARLEAVFTAPTGETYTPREWFVCPLPMIRQVIAKILDGSIIGKVYNASSGFLEEYQAVDRSPDFYTDLTGLRVLQLIISQDPFDDIVEGTKTVEYRELRPSTLGKYTYVDKKDGKRYLRPFDVLKLYVGYHAKRDRMLVRIKGIELSTEEANCINYELGEIIEIHRWREEES